MRPWRTTLKVFAEFVLTAPYRPHLVRKYLIVAVALFASACGSDKKNQIAISTLPVSRRDIVIDAQATGVVEPINIVEVKSKASGMITKMTVETGSVVKAGDLLIQIETRDTKNQYDQTAAALAAAKSKLEVSSAQKKRSDQLFKDRIITATEHEAATLDYANAQSQLVAANTNMDLSKQRLEDATVTAPVAGTIIEKTVSLGTVITSATGSLGGGTTLLKMADLGMVRVRALFNETDIGQVKPGQTATVTVDAYPERRFTGLVEKIEPQAVIQQNVTMFPVLVTLDNGEGLLKPGMNGETSVLVDQRIGVIAVPNDALRNPREAAATAPILGLNADSVRAQVTAQQQSMRGGRGGNGGGRGNGGGAGRAGAPAVPAQTSQGDVDLPQQGQGGGGGGGQQIEVSDKDCAAVAAAFKKKPAEKAKLDGMRQQMMSGAMTRDQMREESQKVYAAVGIDSKIGGACRRKEMMANGGGQGGGMGRGGQAGGGMPGGNGGGGSRAGAASGSAAAPQGAGRSGGARGGQGGQGGGLNIGGGEQAGGAGAFRRPRSGLVFVKEGDTFKPRVVMLGASNFDYTEIVSGLKEGEQVALLASAALQAQRQQQNDRMKQNSGVPGMQAAPAAGAGGGARAGGGGGGGGGGGRP